MAKKMNKTARVSASTADMPEGPPMKDRQHISIRQIKNGHIVNHSGVKDGKHYDEEMYKPHPPKIDMGTSSPKQAKAREKRLTGKPV